MTVPATGISEAEPLIAIVPLNGPGASSASGPESVTERSVCPCTPSMNPRGAAGVGTAARSTKRSTARDVMGYIRKMPNSVSGIGALKDADSASDRAARVSAGSSTPSSHSRAVA